MEKVAEPYEVIVVDDVSTDSTYQIAQQMGARTLRVEHCDDGTASVPHDPACRLGVVRVVRELFSEDQVLLL